MDNSSDLIHLEWIRSYLLTTYQLFSSGKKPPRPMNPNLLPILTKNRNLIIANDAEVMTKPMIYGLALSAMDPRFDVKTATFESIRNYLIQFIASCEFSVSVLEKQSVSNMLEYGKLATSLMTYYLQTVMSPSTINSQFVGHELHTYEMAFMYWIRTTVSQEVPSFKADFMFDIGKAQVIPVMIAKVRPELIHLSRMVFRKELSDIEVKSNWNELSVALTVLGVQKPHIIETEDYLCLLCFMASFYNAISSNLPSCVFQPRAPGPGMQTSAYRLQKVDFLIEKIRELSVPSKHAHLAPPLQKIVQMTQPTSTQSEPQIINQPQYIPPLPQPKQNIAQVYQLPQPTNTNDKKQEENDIFDEHLKILQRAAKKGSQKNSPKKKVKDEKKFTKEEEEESSDEDIPPKVIAKGYRFQPKRPLSKKPVPTESDIAVRPSKAPKQSYLPQSKQNDIFSRAEKVLGNDNGNVRPQAAANLFSKAKLGEKLKNKRKEEDEILRRKIKREEPSSPRRELNHEYDSEEEELPEPVFAKEKTPAEERQIIKSSKPPVLGYADIRRKRMQMEEKTKNALMKIKNKKENERQIIKSNRKDQVSDDYSDEEEPKQIIRSSPPKSKIPIRVAPIPEVHSYSSSESSENEHAPKFVEIPQQKEKSSLLNSLLDYSDDDDLKPIIRKPQEYIQELHSDSKINENQTDTSHNEKTQEKLQSEPNGNTKSDSENLNSDTLLYSSGYEESLDEISKSIKLESKDEKKEDDEVIQGISSSSEEDDLNLSLPKQSNDIDTEQKDNNDALSDSLGLPPPTNFQDIMKGNVNVSEASDSFSKEVEKRAPNWVRNSNAFQKTDSSGKSLQAFLENELEVMKEEDSIKTESTAKSSSYMYYYEEEFSDTMIKSSSESVIKNKSSSQATLSKELAHTKKFKFELISDQSDSDADAPLATKRFESKQSSDPLVQSKEINNESSSESEEETIYEYDESETKFTLKTKKFEVPASLKSEEINETVTETVTNTTTIPDFIEKTIDDTTINEDSNDQNSQTQQSHKNLTGKESTQSKENENIEESLTLSLSDNDNEIDQTLEIPEEPSKSKKENEAEDIISTSASKESKSKADLPDEKSSSSVIRNSILGTRDSILEAKDHSSGKALDLSLSLLSETDLENESHSSKSPEKPEINSMDNDLVSFESIQSASSKKSTQSSPFDVIRKAINDKSSESSSAHPTRASIESNDKVDETAKVILPSITVPQKSNLFSTQELSSSSSEEESEVEESIIKPTISASSEIKIRSSFNPIESSELQKSTSIEKPVLTDSDSDPDIIPSMIESSSKLEIEQDPAHSSFFDSLNNSETLSPKSTTESVRQLRLSLTGGTIPLTQEDQDVDTDSFLKHEETYRMEEEDVIEDVIEDGFDIDDIRKSTTKDLIPDSPKASPNLRVTFNSDVLKATMSPKIPTKTPEDLFDTSAIDSSVSKISSAPSIQSPSTPPRTSSPIQMDSPPVLTNTTPESLSPRSSKSQSPLKLSPVRQPILKGIHDFIAFTKDLEASEMESVSATSQNHKSLKDLQNSSLRASISDHSSEIAKTNNNELFSNTESGSETSDFNERIDLSTPPLKVVSPPAISSQSRPPKSISSGIVISSNSSDDHQDGVSHLSDNEEIFGLTDDQPIPKKSSASNSILNDDILSKSTGTVDLSVDFSQPALTSSEISTMKDSTLPKPEKVEISPSATLNQTRQSIGRHSGPRVSFPQEFVSVPSIFSATGTMGDSNNSSVSISVEKRLKSYADSHSSLSIDSEMKLAESQKEEERAYKSVYPNAHTMSVAEITSAVAKELNVSRTNPAVPRVVSQICSAIGRGNSDPFNTTQNISTDTAPEVATDSESTENYGSDDSDEYF